MRKRGDGEDAVRNIARDVEQGIAVEYAVYDVSFERDFVHDPGLFAEAALHFRRATNLHRHAHKRQAGKE
jgi:hypothetical protein